MQIQCKRERERDKVHGRRRRQKKTRKLSGKRDKKKNVSEGGENSRAACTKTGTENPETLMNMKETR